MGINHLEELPSDWWAWIQAQKPIIWWKDRRRWESIGILPQVWPVGESRRADQAGLVTVNGQVVRELATTIKTGDKVDEAAHEKRTKTRCAS